MKRGMNTYKMCLLVVLLLSVIISCGGGGDSSSPPPAPAQAQGFWLGALSTGYQANFLVLDTSTIWGIYGTTVGSTFYVYGMVQGNVSFSGNTLTSSDGRDFSYTGAVTPGALVATYTASNISGMAGTVSFSASRVASTTYNYDQPASLTSLVGTWNGSLLTSGTASITVAANGQFTGSSNGCSFTGTLTPRSSGKNFFITTVQFGAAPCAAPGETGTGIAITYPLASGGQQLIIGITNAARSLGTAFFAVR